MPHHRGHRDTEGRPAPNQTHKLYHTNPQALPQRTRSTTKGESSAGMRGSVLVQRWCKRLGREGADFGNFELYPRRSACFGGGFCSLCVSVSSVVSKI